MITSVTMTPAYSATAVTLHGGATASTRSLSKIEGLVGTPQPRVIERVRPGVDGVILDETRFVDGRTIVLEGELWGASGGASLEDLSTISEAFASTLMADATLTVTFENDGGKTRYTARVLHWTVADRDAHEKMGFHEGWGLCADQLAALAARI